MGYDGQATYVILAHLSENNNLPELARVAAERALGAPTPACWPIDCCLPEQHRATFFYSISKPF